MENERQTDLEQWMVAPSTGCLCHHYVHQQLGNSEDERTPVADSQTQHSDSSRSSLSAFWYHFSTLLIAITTYRDTVFLWLVETH